ncbi:hypothetical protein FRC07_004822, partial [Ceratobasidium sp. 392]
MIDHLTQQPPDPFTSDGTVTTFDNLGSLSDWSLPDLESLSPAASELVGFLNPDLWGDIGNNTVSSCMSRASLVRNDNPNSSSRPNLDVAEPHPFPSLSTNDDQPHGGLDKRFAEDQDVSSATDDDYIGLTVANLSGDDGEFTDPTLGLDPDEVNIRRMLDELALWIESLKPPGDASLEPAALDIRSPTGPATPEQAAGYTPIIPPLAADPTLLSPADSGPLGILSPVPPADPTTLCSGFDQTLGFVPTLPPVEPWSFPSPNSSGYLSASPLPDLSPASSDSSFTSNVSIEYPSLFLAPAYSTLVSAPASSFPVPADTGRPKSKEEELKLKAEIDAYVDSLGHRRNHRGPGKKYPCPWCGGGGKKPHELK